MALPKAVEEANRRAEELHRQVYGNTETPPQGTPEATPAPEAEPKAEVPAQTPTQPPTEVTPVAPVATQEDDSWKRKYEVLDGKYKAEIPRMAAELRNLKAQLQDAMTKAAPAAPAPSRLKPEEVEEYGEKFIDVVKRAASEVVSTEEVGEIRNSVDQLRNETLRLAKERFYTDLNRQAPKWESLNEDKNFLTWLAGIDPYTGQMRQDLFDQAVSQMDAWRVANFFTSYGGEQSPASPPEQDPLADQIEPPTSRVSAPPPGKKIWTTTEIGRFYADLRARRLDPVDAKRIEADIFAAQTEGRIRQ